MKNLTQKAVSLLVYMAITLWTVILWKVAFCAPMGEVSMNMQEPPPFDMEMPDVILEAEKSYLLGFPIVLSVTFDNNTEGIKFLDLPELGLLLARAPMAIEMEPTGAGVPLSIPPSSERTGVPRMTLAPGERKRMALDLSNFGLDIQPCKYRLTLTLHIDGYSQHSNSVEVEFVMPSLEDMAEATRLRRLGVSPVDTGAWAPFLERNWNTVEVSPELSSDAARQLALHLFLHRAFYGPDDVAQLDISALRTFEGPTMSAEVSVLEFEIFNASNDAIARDGLGQTILGQWPGLSYRLQQILQDRGLLTTGRRLFGADRKFVEPPIWYPYRD